MTADVPDINSVEAEYQTRSANNFLLFVRGIVIPSATGPQLLDGCIAPFQEEAFIQLGESLKAVRNGEKPTCRRFWVERTKKAGKDSDLALCLLWLMAFPRRPILVQVCAANQKQAGIIKRRVEDVLYYNPWLTERVTVQQNKIIGLGDVGTVVIEATGSAGASHGDTPDVLVLNELVHVDKWAVMETHMNNADGVPRGVVIISTNAGIRGTKAERWRRNAELQKDRWKILEYKELAPWLSREDELEAKRRDPVGSEYLRLWKGVWPSGRGGAVDDASIDNCFRLAGPLTAPESGWYYLAGLDLGVSHDHAGVVLLGVNRMEQRIKVGWVRGFQPTVPNDKGGLEVNSEAVENTCLWLHKTFGVRWFGYDPAAGGSFMAQRLRRSGVPMREMSFASRKNQNSMALAFVQSVKDGRLECYEDEDGRLRRDFGKFSISYKPSSGYKLESVSDEWGHADVGVSLVIALPQAMWLLGIDFGVAENNVVAIEEAPELTDDDVNQLPEELRDIVDFDNNTSKDARRASRCREFDILNDIG